MSFFLRMLLIVVLSSALLPGSLFAEVLAKTSLAEDSAQTIEAVLAENAKRTTLVKLNPFGSNLFNGAFRDRPQDALNPNYKIATGDRVAVRIWGATNFNDVLPVDMQGNIFIPAYGPIRVGGVPNSQLNAVVTSSVRKVFKDSVNVYTSLNNAQPVSVYVTGSVMSPGRFSGVPSSSVLYFLDSADGIDPERGSYRVVNIIRANEVLTSIDLYKFLTEGTMQSFQFQEGDTVFVSSRSRNISVDGEVRNRNHFELEDKSYSGQDIIELSLPNTVASHASVLGFRDGARIARYMTIAEFSKFEIDNGDKITFKSDIAEGMIVVELEGEFEGQSQYVLPKNARIMDLLDHIKIDPKEARYDAVSIQRRSIAARQKDALNESLNRIESAYFTASSHTNEEAAIRVQESRMISEFIKRARTVEPNGRLVLASSGDVRNIRLEMGDIITIPRKVESVMVNGEIMVSQAILWDKKLDVQEYIDKSGGYTDQANRKSLLLVKQSGEVLKGGDFTVEPGDEIVVLPKVPVKSLQLASTIADIVYKIAIAASVAIAL